MFQTYKKCYLKMRYFLRNPVRLQHLQNKVIDWNYQMKGELNKEFIKVLVN